MPDRIDGQAVVPRVVCLDRARDDAREVAVESRRRSEVCLERVCEGAELRKVGFENGGGAGEGERGFAEIDGAG